MNVNDFDDLQSDDPPIGVCFLCRLPVLGLSGQDQYLDTYMLQPGHPALLKNAFGPCHTCCLLRSPWGKEWALQRIRFKAKSGTRLVSDLHPGITVFRNIALANLEVFNSEGEMWVIKNSDILTSTNSYGSVIDICDDVSWNLECFSSKIAPLHEECLGRGIIELDALIDAVDLRDKLQYPNAVQGALVKCNKSQVDIGNSYWIVGRLSYHLFVPPSVESAVRYWRSIHVK